MVLEQGPLEKVKYNDSPTQGIGVSHRVIGRAGGGVL
jgi:hypothetical protein